MKVFNSFEKEQILKLFKSFILENKDWVVNLLVKQEPKLEPEKSEKHYDRVRINYLIFIWVIGLSLNILTKNYQLFIDYSIFAFIILIVATADTIQFLRDKYYAPEFNTFKGFKDSPRAKSLWLISTSIIISASIIAGAGTITFTNNNQSTIQKPEINLLFEGDTSKDTSNYSIEPIEYKEE